MLKRLLHAWVRHGVVLLPLGLIVGTAVGVILGDLRFGVLAGLGLGALFAGLFGLRAR